MRSPISALALVLGALVLAAAPGVNGDVYSDLEKWVVKNGGWLKTRIGKNKNGVRGLFTTVDGKRGDFVAEIPSSTMINAGSLDGSIMTGTLLVLRELNEPHSRLNPYKATWPKPNEVLNNCNMPVKYSYMYDPYWQKLVNLTQNYLRAALEGKINQDLEYTVKETVGDAKVTFEDMQYACAIASTRYVTEDTRRRLLMIPIFDMQNHVRFCPHSTTQLGGGDTIHIVLGKDVKAGDELCYPYHSNMRDDYGVFHYGFLQDLEDPPILMETDHRDFDAEKEHQEYLSDEFLTSDDPAVLKAEQSRLQTILDRVLSDEKKWPAGPKKGTDYAYDTLKELHERRKNALSYEIKRLQKSMDELKTKSSKK